MPSVDNRVVEMRFDNKEFESGVSTSLSTLEKLKQSLNLEDATKGFDNIDKAAKGISFDGISESLQVVSDHFSALGIIGDQVLRRIGDAIFDLETQFVSLVKSMSVDQVTAGFDKYERKTKAVQTIMNATGKSIDDVSASLDKLNWFTDETSYRYESMVDNISKFTSSNVDLDVAITSMIGIADAAGLAGASVDDASHAMDGFSKAIAQGYMTRQNWQWIRTAHMDTAQFKDTLIETAVSVGTLTKTGEGLYQTMEGNAVSVADFETATYSEAKNGTGTGFEGIGWKKRTYDSNYTFYFPAYDGATSTSTTTSTTTTTSSGVRRQELPEMAWRHGGRHIRLRDQKGGGQGVPDRKGADRRRRGRAKDLRRAVGMSRQ